MLHSFDIAARGAGRAPATADVAPSADGERDPDPATGWSRFWYAWVAAGFLRGYLDAVEAANAVGGLLPTSRDDLALFLDALMLEKATQEVVYELEHRPNWVGLAAGVLLDLLGAPPTLATAPETG